MTDLEQEIAHLQGLYAMHRENIRYLERQLAQHGMTPPLGLLHQLKHEREKLHQVKERLAELGVRVVPGETSTEESPELQIERARVLTRPTQKRRPVNWEKVVAIAGVIGVLIAICAYLALSARSVLVAWLFRPTATPTKTPTTVTDTPMLTPMPSPTPTPYYVEIVVDASERMSDEFEGGTTKMESAWQTASTIARVRTQQGQFVKIRLFGGRDSPGGGSCQTSYSLFDFTNDAQQIMNYLAQQPPTPGGQAAVVTALLDAADELNRRENIGREIILLTGGDDGCNVALSAFYNSANQSLWTQTFVVLFSDQDFGPFITLETQGANIYYDLVRDRAEAEAVAEEIAVAAVSVAMGPTPTPTSPPPTSVAPGTPPPTSTPKPPPPTPFERVATATHTPIPTPTHTPTPAPTHTPTPAPTHTPTATPTFTPTATSTSTPAPMPLSLDDPSFEGSGFRTPSWWWHWGWPPSDDGGTRDPDATDCVHSGNQALKITRVTTASVSAGNVVMQAIPFSAGQRLQFNAWLKILDLLEGEAYVELVFATDDNPELKKYTGDKYNSPIQDWTRIEVQGIAPEGTTKAELKLVVMYEPEGTGVVCFDDISAFIQQQ